MEKLQTLFWILIGLGAFIWRMVQKAKATTQREQQERKFSRPDSTGRPRPVAPLPATSFEEMLKQMQAQNRAGNSPNQTTPAGRPLPQETARAPRTLEQPATAARSLERQKEARSLEAPAHEARRAAGLPRTATQHGQEDYWSRVQRQQREEVRQQALSGIQERLRNPADLRAAFVLSEILQRKF